MVARSNNTANANGGVSYANSNNDSANVNANFGSRLAFKNEELAEYAGKQFIDIYADFCFICSFFVYSEYVSVMNFYLCKQMTVVQIRLKIKVSELH